VGPVEPIEQLAAQREESRRLGRLCRRLFQFISIHHYEGILSLYEPLERSKVDPEQVVSEKLDIPIDALDQVAARVAVNEIRFSREQPPTWANVPVVVTYRDLRDNTLRRRKVSVRWVKQGGQWFVNVGDNSEDPSHKPRP